MPFFTERILSLKRIIARSLWSVKVEKCYTASVKKEVEAKQAEIVSGKFKVFSGPMKLQDGTMKLAAGQAFTDADIDNLIGPQVSGLPGTIGIGLDRGWA